MVAHQPFDGLALVLLQPEPRRNLARDLRAQNRMILGPTLADIVQEQRDVARRLPDTAPAWYDYRDSATSGSDVYAQNAFAGEPIFRDGFESGTTSAWSTGGVR